jgi:hypothetical protein
LRLLDPCRNAEIGRFGQGFAIAKAMVEAYRHHRCPKRTWAYPKEVELPVQNLDLFAPFVIPNKTERSRFTSLLNAETRLVFDLQFSLMSTGGS